jgi:hypothetical protein
VIPQNVHEWDKDVIVIKNVKIIDANVMKKIYSAILAYVKIVLNLIEKRVEQYIINVQIISLLDTNFLD